MYLMLYRLIDDLSLSGPALGALLARARDKAGRLLPAAYVTDEDIASLRALLFGSYPLATPTKPRVIGSFGEPANITAFYGSITVDWTNPSGPEVIGSQEPSRVTGSTSRVTYSDDAVIGGGVVQQFSSGGIALFVAC